MRRARRIILQINRICSTPLAGFVNLDYNVWTKTRSTKFNILNRELTMGNTVKPELTTTYE